jgi:hypothetical protein
MLTREVYAFICGVNTCDIPNPKAAQRLREYPRATPNVYCVQILEYLVLCKRDIPLSMCLHQISPDKVGPHLIELMQLCLWAIGRPPIIDGSVKLYLLIPHTTKHSGFLIQHFTNIFPSVNNVCCEQLTWWRRGISVKFVKVYLKQRVCGRRSFY